MRPASSTRSSSSGLVVTASTRSSARSQGARRRSSCSSIGRPATSISTLPGSRCEVIRAWTMTTRCIPSIVTRYPRPPVRPRQPSPLRVAIYDPYGNGTGLARALAAAGHTVVADGRADALLIETDMPKFEFREIIDRHKDMGAKVFLYPHGAGLQLLYDNLCEPYEAVDGSLLVGVGHTETLRRIDY